MVRPGRAFAIAAGWIVLTLASIIGLILLAFWRPRHDPPNNPGMFGGPGLIVLFCAVWAAILLPIGLVAAGIWVSRRRDGARTTAGLGAQAAAIGLVCAFAGVLGYLCLQGTVQAMFF